MRNGKRNISVGWLTPSEQVEMKKAKEKFVDKHLMGEPCGDRVFIMGLIRLFTRGEI